MFSFWSRWTASARRRRHDVSTNLNPNLNPNITRSPRLVPLRVPVRPARSTRSSMGD